MASKYPDRWLNYTSIGAQVEGTPFVPLKVPLKNAFFKGRKKDSFTPVDVCSQIPNLGMIIDLTFTKKYYDPVEFTNRNIEHQKIYTKGHEIPQRSLVTKFIDIVKKFLSDEQNSDKLVGVHCTHGLNRTGYFVCAYMILEQGRNPRDTINVFNKARSHQMERANYLNSLLTLNSTERYDYAECSWRRDRLPRNYDPSRSREHRENYRRRDYGGDGYNDLPVDVNGNDERSRQYNSRGQHNNQYRWSRDGHREK